MTKDEIDLEYIRRCLREAAEAYKRYYDAEPPNDDHAGAG